MRDLVVFSTHRARAQACALEYPGVIEVDVEQVIATSEPTLTLRPYDRCYRLDDRLHVRVRDRNERTAGGRKKVWLLSVFDVSYAPGEDALAVEHRYERGGEE